MRFNPRSPRGGATSGARNNSSHSDVSIHAPHEGERLDKMHTYELIEMFQSTLPTRGSDSRHLFHRRPDPCFNPRSPRGGATKKALADGEMRYVSIHAPHEGERLALINHEIDGNGFNPRSPRGGATPLPLIRLNSCLSFNPRSPRGGATSGSTHYRTAAVSFNPRSPRGGAT